MLPASKRQVRHTNLQMDFSSLAKVACASDAAAEILKRHMRAARAEIGHLNLSKKKKAAVPTHAHCNISRPATRGPPTFGGRVQTPGRHPEVVVPPAGGVVHSTSTASPSPRSARTSTHSIHQPAHKTREHAQPIPRDPPKIYDERKSKV